jgi:hypothetical protein
VAPYKINLLDKSGSPEAEEVLEFDSDDAVIDHVGEIGHRDAIEVWQGERCVALFPPWPAAQLRGSAWR